ncbi:MAG TPA: TPM domain-containing protein [Candidatus Omnitrophota bacterium]|nr:TPM domain-containing protein [Candidatus Omnitrophota bacterium]
MNQNKNKLFRIIVAGLLLAVIFWASKNIIHRYPLMRQTAPSLAEILKKRPMPLRHIYDFAGKLTHGFENHESQLSHFEKKYDIETVVVTLPSLEGKDIKTVAAEMFSRWKIGEQFSQKGLLLLIAFKEQELKLEVGYGVEEIFTDLFCGYIERMSIQPFFQAGQFGSGLLAIWEHFIARAEDTLTEEQMKAYLSNVSPYISGGAGVKDVFQVPGVVVPKPLSPEIQEKFKPQPNPDALVKAVRETCRLCVQSEATGMMTPASQAMIREIGMKPSRLQCDNGLKSWSGPYEILQSGDYAVAMFFTTDKAQPMMMRKGKEGWLLDVFSMRRHAWFDHSNRLFIKGKNFPYEFAFNAGDYVSIPRDGYAYEYGLLSCTKETGQSCSDQLQEKLEHFKDRAVKSPQDPQALLELAKVYIDLSLQTQAADTLAQVIRLNPHEADAYKYMAYLQFDLLGAPQKTLDQIDLYLRLRPDDRKILLWKARSEERVGDYKKAFETIKTYCEDYKKSAWCLNYLGYYSFLANQKKQAEGYFKKALKLDPANTYAQQYLQRIKSKTS